jgi:hypothetical protein
MTAQTISENVERGFTGIYGISKHIYIDEFTLNKTGENVMVQIPGIGRVVHFPAGYIAFHEDNMWMFQLSQLHFTITLETIPHENFALSSILKIGRSDGSVHEAFFGARQGFRIDRTRNDLTGGCRFNMDCTSESLSEYCEMTKNVGIKSILKLNGIDSIQVNLVHSDIIKSELFNTPFKRECLILFIDKLNTWKNGTLMPFLEANDIPVMPYIEIPSLDISL